MSGIPSRILLWLVSAILLLPFLIVAGVSIGASKTISFPPTSFSLAWYKQLLTEPEWLSAIGISLLVAVIAAFISVILALAINYALWRTGSGFAKFVFALGIGPFLLPPIILALGAALFWAEFGWYGRIEATVISHGVFFVTLPLVVIARGFAGINNEAIEAARTLGASGWSLFRSIIFPLIFPYALTGFALVAIISVNEYLIANMISGFVVETLPIKIFNNVRYGYSPVVAAASMLFVAVTVSVLIVVSRLTDLLKLLGAKEE